MGLSEELKKSDKAWFSEMLGLSKQEIRRRLKICIKTEEDLIRLFDDMRGATGNSLRDFMENYGDFSDRLNVIYSTASESALEVETPFSAQFDRKARDSFLEIMPVTARRLNDTAAEDWEKFIAETWLFSTMRATRAARFVTNSLCECNSFERLKQQGYKYKVWNTILDGRERLTHFIANGQRVAVDQPFMVGGYQMMFPRDQTYGAPLREVINCRCTITGA